MFLISLLDRKILDFKERQHLIHSYSKLSEKGRKIVISDATFGDNVTIPIPAVERGRADALNIIGVITDISDNNNTALLLMEVC